MIVDVHRASCHGKALLAWRHLFSCGITAVAWIVKLVGFAHCRVVERRIVGHRDVQRVACVQVQRWILQAVGSHVAIQLSAHRIAGRLVGELDIQDSVLAVKRRRVGGYAARRETWAGFGTGGTGVWPKALTGRRVRSACVLGLLPVGRPFGRLSKNKIPPHLCVIDHGLAWLPASGSQVAARARQRKRD
jgi:hypothetical protein